VHRHIERVLGSLLGMSTSIQISVIKVVNHASIQLQCKREYNILLRIFFQSGFFVTEGQ
jgi:hypothetical protein